MLVSQFVRVCLSVCVSVCMPILQTLLYESDYSAHHRTVVLKQLTSVSYFLLAETQLKPKLWHVISGTQHCCCHNHNVLVTETLFKRFRVYMVHTFNCMFCINFFLKCLHWNALVIHMYFIITFSYMYILYFDHIQPTSLALSSPSSPQLVPISFTSFFYYFV